VSAAGRSGLTLYHNPACSKSRATLALIRGQGIEPKVIEYLKTPPSRAEFKRITALLGVGAADLLRKGEAKYREHYAGKDLSNDEAIDAMLAHPILTERPIAVTNAAAAIGRPPENVLPLLARIK
jgi:arsenate reductase